MEKKLLRVRPLEERDIEKVMDLLEQVNLVHHKGRPDIFIHATKYTAEDVRDIFVGSEIYPVFVCVEEDASGGEKVLGHGFCQVQDNPGNSVVRGKKSLYVDDICVDEEARGKGVGRMLYNYILDYAQSEGTFDSITLNVWAFNETAYKFYLEMGLTPQRIIMEKTLEKNS